MRSFSGHPIGGSLDKTWQEMEALIIPIWCRWFCASGKESDLELVPFFYRMSLWWCETVLARVKPISSLFEPWAPQSTKLASKGIARYWLHTTTVCVRHCVIPIDIYLYRSDFWRGNGIRLQFNSVIISSTIFGWRAKRLASWFCFATHHQT